MKKTLVIMGTHPNGLKSFDWERTDCDIWMFNEAPNIKVEGKLLYPKSDAVFQLHHEAIWKNPKNRVDEDHFKWLTSGKTPTVYMQDAYKNVPKSKKYPIEEVLSLVENVEIVAFGKKKNFRYFSSSPDFALALAAKMCKHGRKYNRIEIHGIELATESEYQFQKTGFGFWTGYLAALGVKVIIYNSIFDTPMYGYEGDAAISSEYLAKRISDLTVEFGDSKERYTEDTRAFLDTLLPQLLGKNISKDIESRLNEIIKKYEQAGIINGKIKECERYLGKAITMEQASGASVFALGEFDQTRQAYQSQYNTLRTQVTDLNAKIGFLLSRLINLKKGSKKRQRDLDEFCAMVGDFMNQNMFLLHVVGGIQENQHYMDSIKFSLSSAREKK